MGASETKETKKNIMKTFNITEDDFKKIVKSFRENSENGVINEEHFVKSFEGILSDESAHAVFRTFDTNKNGALEAQEYLMMMCITNFGTPEQKLKASFDLFDANNDNYLSREEVKNVLVSIVKQKIITNKFQETGEHVSSSKITLSEKDMNTINNVIAKVFENVDTDKNDLIDFEEFNAGLQEHPEVCTFFKQF